jgi:Tol biopolymer transport system component
MALAPRSSGPIAFSSNRSGTDEVYLANDDGSIVTPLTEGGTPAWSRDGRRLALVRRFDTYVINRDGTNLRYVTAGVGPAWSPDGGALVVESWVALAIPRSPRQRGRVEPAAAVLERRLPRFRASVVA